jgi:hypothetical protein
MHRHFALNPFVLAAFAVATCAVASFTAAPSAAASSAAGASTGAAPPPLQVDLNAFDASKRSIALPNGITLAYIDRPISTEDGRSAPVVVLIHGYTDSARDWVPMLP